MRSGTTARQRRGRFSQPTCEFPSFPDATVDQIRVLTTIRWAVKLRANVWDLVPQRERLESYRGVG